MSKHTPLCRRILSSKTCTQSAVYVRHRTTHASQLERFPVVTSLGLALRSAALAKIAA